MTTSLASLSWMETVPCLEHCQETREKFYTSSQLIYPRSTVCLMTLSDLVGGKHCWVMNDTTIAMSGKKCTSFFSNDWTNNVWLNNYMSNRHLVYPTRVKVLVKHKSFEHFWGFLLLRLPHFTISSKFYTSVLENNYINCVDNVIWGTLLVSVLVWWILLFLYHLCLHLGYASLRDIRNSTFNLK